MKMTAIFLVLGTAFPALAQVSVTAPANNSQVATSVQFVATAHTAGWSFSLLIGYSL
jgi:hypothetical protein